MKRITQAAVETVVSLIALAIPGSAAHLGSAARQSFDRYVATVEARLARQHAIPDTYLAALNGDPSLRADTINELRTGSSRIESVAGGIREVPGGLLHHWRGDAFVPGAKAQDMQSLLRDYNRLALYYSPEVESSRALAEHAGTTTVAMRMVRQVVVTVVLDGEYDVQTQMTGTTRGYSVSRSAHIWEVDSPGTSRERRMPEGDDDGFLWRLNSYWSFVELPDGLLIECEAVSLTRDVPGGLRWLAGPLVQQLPRESLEFTLKATRNALAAKSRKDVHL
ncbi:MAG TPA: hypothetical protein VE779_09300 [Candidatus Angelobacter sp.]|nr:hypothetical protein [Candidatus Angelobacter sp.]